MKKNCTLILLLFCFIPVSVLASDFQITEDAGILMLILAAMLAASEVLALIPTVRSNSIFQLIVSILRRLARR